MKFFKEWYTFNARNATIECFFYLNNSLHKRHSSWNRPSHGPHYSLFFLLVICCRASQKYTVHEVLDFWKIFRGQYQSKYLKKLKTTLLDVIDLDKKTVNSMWEKTFFETWGKVGAALVWHLWGNQNLKYYKTKQNKNQNYGIWWFLMFCIIILCYCPSQEQPEYKKFYLFWKRFLWPVSLERTYKVINGGPWHIVSYYFRSFTQSSVRKSMLI